MLKSRSGFLITLIAVVAAACSKGAAFNPVDGATNASAAGHSLGDSAESSAGGFGSKNGPGAASRGPGNLSGAPAADSCQSGTETETQNSPTSATITFTNCMYSGSAGTETINGTIEVTESTVGGLKFTASHDLTVAIVGAGPNVGITENFKLTGDRSADFLAAGTSFTMSDATEDSGTIVAGAKTFAVSDGKSWSDVYAPDSAWTPGTVLVSGNLAISGGWNLHVNDQSSSATLSSNGLRIGAACPTHIVAGTLNASWMGSAGRTATLAVTWTACGVRSVTYTGP